MKFTPISHIFSAEQLKNGFAMDGLKDFSNEQVEQAFADSGLSIDPLVSRAAMDEYVAMNTTASISSWVQFFQFFYPSAITMATRARKAEAVGGAYKAGDWKDDEVVFPFVERIGQARVYSDAANTPFASWNTNFEKRNVVRFELGLRVGQLEEQRSAAMRMNSTDIKRKAVSEALALARNDVYFSGYTGNTFGFLNDPNLSSYVQVAQNAAADSRAWKDKTFNEIVADINVAFNKLASNLEGHLDSTDARLTLVLPTAVLGSLNTPNTYGKSVREYLNETYPNMEIIAIPNLNGANAGQNGFYLMLKEFNGSFVQGQFYQEMFRLVGMMRITKGFEEDFSNATAGCFVAQPLAIVRYTDI